MFVYLIEHTLTLFTFLSIILPGHLRPQLVLVALGNPLNPLDLIVLAVLVGQVGQKLL